MATSLKDRLVSWKGCGSPGAAGNQEKTDISTSDNGSDDVRAVMGNGGASEREKGTSWEGGYRVPAIFNWPGKIEPKQVDGIGATLICTLPSLA